MKNMIYPVIAVCMLLFSACTVNAVAENQPRRISASQDMEIIAEGAVPILVAEIESLAPTLSEFSLSPRIYVLPPPNMDGEMSVEQDMAQRRSRRNFQDKPLSIEQLSQILWAAYGITLPRPDAPQLRGGLRTTPSAGALFPLEIYAVIGNVDGIAPGVYRYNPEEHTIIMVIDGDIRGSVSDASLGQRSIRDAPVTIFYSAVFDRMIPRYGERGIMYTHMEVGHSAQNVYLQVEALGLGTVAVGAFMDDMIRDVFNLPADETPLYLMPVGYFY